MAFAALEGYAPRREKAWSVGRKGPSVQFLCEAIIALSIGQRSRRRRAGKMRIPGKAGASIGSDKRTGAIAAAMCQTSGCVSQNRVRLLSLGTALCHHVSHFEAPSTLRFWPRLVNNRRFTRRRVLRRPPVSHASERAARGAPHKNTIDLQWKIAAEKRCWRENNRKQWKNRAQNNRNRQTSLA